jgi:serine/threonine protein kinase/Leucine-rich repeat (LRR) protein
MNTSSAYTPGREIARGGMGAILSATDQTLDREVAMKVMLEAGEQDPIARQRFLREALVLARLEHPNIVPIHEMGRNAEGRLFYTMKLVKGRTLQAILTAIKKGDAATAQHYTLDRLLTIYRKVCDAVAFAHHHRIIHRDLKPENVMVGEFGEVLVMDWGLAKHLDDEAHAQTEAQANRPALAEGIQELSDAQLAAGESGLTMEGAVMGSPQYMPPEQAEGRLADLGTHSDIYSLGGILYAILTLRHPVEGLKVSEVLSKVISGEITPPTHYNASRAGGAKLTGGTVADASKVVGLPHCPAGKVPASLSAVTMRAMALKPADRYGEVGQIVADVEAYQGGFATSAEKADALTLALLFIRRNKVLSTAGALVLLIILIALPLVIASERKAKANAKTAQEQEAKAKATLADLRRTAPVFYQQAQVDFADGKRGAALEKLGYAIQLDETAADYQLFRAHLKQSFEQLTEAAEDYRRVLALRPADASATTNLALCEKLLKESGGAALNRDQKLQLLAALRAQKRMLEAAPLAAELDPDITATRNAIHARLRELKNKPGWVFNSVVALPDGTFKIDFLKNTLADFSVLKDLPISVLTFRDSPISDLSSMAGLPLKELHIIDTTKVSDLSPLRGMPLERLTVNGLDRDKAPLTDLTPLRGLKLKTLMIMNTGVSDLSPLAGMPLEELSLWGATRLRDLTPLAQCRQLRRLEIRGTSVLDLGPLAGLPLTEFSCGGSKITSIAALAGAPLKMLAIDDTSVTDLSPLAQSTRLEILSMNKTPVSDLEPLAKQPLKWLGVRSTKVVNLSPLAGCANLESVVIPGDAKDVSILRHLPRLKRLSGSMVGGGSSLIFGNPSSFPLPMQTAENFWREYDAKQSPAPKK